MKHLPIATSFGSERLFKTPNLAIYYATLTPVLYIFIAMLFYAAGILFGAAASRNLNSSLAAAITNVLSAVVPILVALPFITRKEVTSHRFGVLMAVGAGLCIAVFAVALNKSFSVNRVGIVAPLVFGGALFLSSLLSLFIFKERMSLLEGCGLAVLSVGLILIIYARAIAK